MKTGSKYYVFNNGNENKVKIFREKNQENMGMKTWIRFEHLKAPPSKSRDSSKIKHENKFSQHEFWKVELFITVSNLEYHRSITEVMSGNQIVFRSHFHLILLLVLFEICDIFCSFLGILETDSSRRTVRLIRYF